MSAHKPGYHINPIVRGKYGEVSKIIEEAQELADALEQGCKVMALLELSDLYGAIEGVLEQNMPGFTMDDVKSMSGITRRAFENGKRGQSK